MIEADRITPTLKASPGIPCALLVLAIGCAPAPAPSPVPQWVSETKPYGSVTPP